MKPRARRKRAILRDRRRGWFGIVPTLGPLNGWDLYMLSKYWAEQRRGTTPGAAPDGKP